MLAIFSIEYKRPRLSVEIYIYIYIYIYLHFLTTLINEVLLSATCSGFHLLPSMTDGCDAAAVWRNVTVASCIIMKVRLYE